MKPPSLSKFNVVQFLLSLHSLVISGERLLANGHATEQDARSNDDASLFVPDSRKNAWHGFLKNERVPRRNREPVPVDYMGNHPFERILEHDSEQSHRQTESYQPMRVQFDTHLLDALVDSYPSHVSYVRNVLLPSLRNFWAETLSIIPAKNIRVPLDGDCATEVKKTTGYALQEFVQYGSDSLRSISNIGDNVAFSSDGTSLVYNNVDLVVIVIPAEGTELCPFGQNAESGQLQTLAFATNCQHDQMDRPTVGYFGICFEMIDPSDRSSKTHQRRLLTIAHEFTHILGMNSYDFPYFYDHTTRRPRTARDSYGKPPAANLLCVDGTFAYSEVPSEDTLRKVTTSNGYIAYEMVTKTVRNVVRNHFDCQTLGGARLENQPTGAGDCFGSHWDHRLFNNEYMAAVYTGASQYVTALTLALLEDSGWYMPNYAVAQNSPFGLGAGCEFVEEKCIQYGGVPEWALGTFCNSPSDIGCSSDRRLVAFCDIAKWNGNLPSGYQYFSDTTLGGGLTQSDFCPAYTTLYKFEVGSDTVTLDCTDTALNSMWIKAQDEVFGDSSRCFESTNGPRGICLNIKCSAGKIVVNAGGRTMECTYPGKILRLPSGTNVICPSFAQICPDSTCEANCSGRGICDYSSTPPKCECFDRSDNSAICLGSSDLWSFAPTISPSPTVSPQPSSSPTITPRPTDQLENSARTHLKRPGRFFANMAIATFLPFFVMFL
ncbi:hypothetical protein ACHAWX_004783 [Stephanocyclus meneghinianus]